MVAHGETVRRRWYRPRYSLRAMFVVLTVLALPATWLGWRVECVRREQRAVRLVQDMGGEVTYDWQREEDPATPGKTRSLPNVPVWLQNLFGVEFFQSVVEVEIVKDCDPEQLTVGSLLFFASFAVRGISVLAEHPTPPRYTTRQMKHFRYSLSRHVALTG